MLKKGAFFTDIHFGRKSNSSIHNQDCLDFIDWFIKQVKNDKSIDYIGFLGDWHESRSALDISTQNYSYEGAKRLNGLGLPVFFIVGNHDMGSRHTRNIYSTIPFNEFENFVVINEITEIDNILGGAIFCPFLSKDEYDSLIPYTNKQLWAGHFEFKGFVLTGYSFKLEHGPDHTEFNKVGTILSGHFHKRQRRDNTHYIGNSFPMDFGDANDIARGMAIYDHVDNSVSYINWLDCPKYIKCKLSQLLDNTMSLVDNSYVDVDVDVPVTYEELGLLEFAYHEKFKLRSFKLDETSKFIQENTQSDQELNIADGTTDELIVSMLRETDSSKFDIDLLVELYRNPI